MTWKPTHKLVLSGLMAAHVIFVRREDGSDGGFVLYDREEWFAESSAWYWQNPDGTIECPHGIVDAKLKPIEE